VAPFTSTNQMKVSEIKAELDLRQVDYDDCFDRESLADRLHEARAQGRADPNILDRFNKQNLEQQFDPDQKVHIGNPDLVDAAVANDGTLPGGMRPDQFQALVDSPDIMALLQNTKMQEAMKIMERKARTKAPGRPRVARDCQGAR
jgi:ankyrin repeat protein